MSGLSDADCEALWLALVDERDKHHRAPDDADTWSLVDAAEPVVIAIVTRAVNEALTDAADELTQRSFVWADEFGVALLADTYRNAARIVRARTT